MTMQELKRTLVCKRLQGWYIKAFRSLRKLNLSTRKALRLEVVVFILLVAIAVWVSGLLRSLVEALASTTSGYTYFGDNISDGDEFDYIVVGAGAAGSAVAARLTMAGLSVLLVEAGGDPNILAKVPGATIALTGSSIDWNYDTLPNYKSCLGYVGKRCRFTRGRCLGGSTNLNIMMYTRGNRQDYDYNITGWTWQDLEPYFLKYEGFRELPRLPKSSEPYHNTSGFVSVGYFGDSGNPWHSRLIEGFKTLNFPYNSDVNAKSQIGVTQVLGYVSGGERVSTAQAYLERTSVKNRLKIAKNTQCTKVIIDDDNVAKGVTVSTDSNDAIRLFAKREVVLSSGTIGTAQLLMLSGVGPQGHIEHLGIPVKANLPVGEGMSDHVLSNLFIKVDHDAKSFDPLSIVSKGLQALQWLTTRSGLLTSIGLTDVTAFINTKCYNYTLRRLINDRPECQKANLQFIHSYYDKGILKFVRSITHKICPYNDYIFNQLLLGNKDSAYITVSVVLLKPKSRGSIQLASANPLEPPIIRPNYLADERDVKEFALGLRIWEQFIESPQIKKYNASILKIRFPQCPEESDRYWECYARQMTHAGQHAMGTAALGKVLDEKLRVKGIKNLRVGDASVLPRVPRGNTAAAVIAIGERLSDFLMQDREL